MFRKKVVFEKSDLEAIKILEDFLPEYIFDAHAHLFDTDFLPGEETVDGNRLICGLEEYRETCGKMLANPKKLRVNIIPWPDASMSDPESENCRKSDEFLLRELEKDSSNVGEIMVRPGESIEQLEKRIAHPGIRGLKCYHTLADKEETWNCSIGEYLPETAWQLANEKQMSITLHMVKEKALADKDNLDYICSMAKRYPDATLILAHAARSFASWTAVESVEKVAHLENVWFDFSAVCESPAMFQIMKKAGVKRCMWGSDYPVAQGRGKAISLADGFYWIFQRDLDNFVSKTPLSSWLRGLENLMAVRQACILAELSRSEIEDLFYNNAARLFGN